MFDTTTWEQVGDAINFDEAPIGSVRYSPDGRFLLTAEATGTITLRDPTTYEPIGARLDGHRAPLGPGPVAVFFTPQPGSERLLSYSEDSEIILWDLESRQRIGGTWPSDRPDPTDMSADGTKLATILGDDILIWNVNPEEWFDIACRAAGRNLTRLEWEQHGPRNDEYQATCPQWPIEE